MFHGQDQVAGFIKRLYETLQEKARKSGTLYHKINDVAVVQAGLIPDL
jgi:hypothetical protein